MKVLLIAPAHGYRQTPQPLLSVSDFPAGFAYIAAALKESGHTVIGLNPNNETTFKEPYYMLVNKVSEAITVHQPDMIGLGGIVTDYQFLKDAIDICRQFAPKTPIVLGGGIISNDREFIFENLHPDYGIVGEGEDTMVQLADGWKDIPNLSYWQDGKPVHNQTDFQNYRDVDKLPFPDYSIFGIDNMLDNYSLATRLLYRYIRPYPRPFTIVTARGCPFNCTFCVHRSGAKYRARSIPNIMEEIRVNYERYKFNILIILDELFAVNKARMKEFCDAILDGKQKYGWDFNWMFQTHASAALDVETLKLAKQAGCFFFSYGIESASPAVIASMNKKIKPEQIIEGIHAAKEAGVGFGGNLIFGDVAETPETISESLEFYRKHCDGAFVFLAFLMPYPGNKLFDTISDRIPDKGTYYANLDQGVPNMTRMPNEMWYQWVNYIQLEERSWLSTKSTPVKSITVEDYSDAVTEYTGRKVSRIEADCPYCGGHLVYREMVGPVPTHSPAFLGVGCQHCNQRIKVNLKERVCH